MKKYGHLFHLHIIVFILGFTAILGKLISIQAIELVWYRTLAASIFIFLIIKLKKGSIKIPLKEMLTYISVGLVVAAHWITFFHAIKVSNVSVTLACLSTTTLFTGIVEPIVLKRKFYWIEALLGVFIIVGLYLIFEFETRYKLGIMFALTSAFLAGVFSVVNKKLTPGKNAHQISFYEMIGGFIVITIYLILSPDFKMEKLSITPMDIVYLIILGSICTAYAFTTVIELMKKISAYVVVLSINLEPLYGVILAYIIFGSSEYMSTGFYAGAVIILLCVFLYQPLMQKFHKH
ncbi:MAG: DMT family transporter [Bacteroidales bacterium]|nr:DMT family transporter [Bacteroidales bacterium]